jgi:O-antigen ligase
MNIINKDITFFKNIIFLVPLSFIFGIAITEFFVLLSIIIFFFFNKQKLTYIDSKIVFLLLFSLYIFLNSLFQITSIDLKLSSLTHFRFIIFSLSIIYFCEMFEVSKKKYSFLILISPLLIIFIDSIFQFFYGVNLIGYEAHYSRISSFFKEELVLGSFLVRILPIILFFILFFKIDIKEYNYHFILFFTLYLITIYIAAGRTAFFLNFIIFATIFVIFKKFRKIIIYSTLFFIFFATFTTYFDLGNTSPANRLFIKTYNEINSKEIRSTDSDQAITKKEKFKIYSDDHQGHILLAIKLFSENKIFGTGPKGFRQYCRKVDYNPNIGICSTHPHNTSIQILTELGLVGLFFYIVAIVFIIFYFFKSLLEKKFDRDYLSFYSITLGLLINIFPLIPGGNFFNNWISIILYYNIGIYLYSFKKCITR